MAPQVSAATIDDLTSRVVALEGKIDKPNAAEAVVPGSFMKTVKDLRDEVAALRAQSDKLAGSVNELKSAPRDASPDVDLSAVNERIDKLEHASRVQSDAIASEKNAQNKPADDTPPPGLQCFRGAGSPNCSAHRWLQAYLPPIAKHCLRRLPCWLPSPSPHSAWATP